MGRAWFAGLVAGALLLLLGLTVLTDRGRAGLRLRGGIEGQAALAEPRAGGELAEVPADMAMGRSSAPPAGRTRAPELAVLVRRSDGRPIVSVEVLAYRGRELVRAGTTGEDGRVELLPFAGRGQLRVRKGEDEVARAEIPAGHGRHEVLVPDRAAVAGVVRLAGAPREHVWLELVTGEEEGWAAQRVRAALEDWGLSNPLRRRVEGTAADGSFRFDWLPPDWHGVLRLREGSAFRLADGSRRLALARPSEGLVLELHRHAAVADLSGRAVLAGVPVPHASWRAVVQTEGWASHSSGECDAEGRFTVALQEEDARVTFLELHEPERGQRRLQAPADVLVGELGDVELAPTQPLPFRVRADTGEPVAGAHAMPLVPRDAGGEGLSVYLMWNEELSFRSAPSDAEGRGLLHWPTASATEVRFEAPGFGPMTVELDADTPLPIEVVLVRGCTLEVRVRGPGGVLPPAGLEVELRADEGPFLGKDGYPRGGLNGPDGFLRGSWGRDGSSFHARCVPDERGSVRFTGLRAGVPLRIALGDELGAELVPPRELVPRTEAPCTLELVTDSRPRRVLVHVRDSLGRPVPRCWVWLEAAQASSRSQASDLTDRAGLALFEAVHARDIDVRVSHPGFRDHESDALALPAGDATLDVVLARDWWPW